jgi:molybdenum cofactor synthesis domain-containing protein
MLSVEVLLVGPILGHDLAREERAKALCDALQETTDLNEQMETRVEWVPDELAQIRRAIRLACDRSRLVLTFGSIGIQLRDHVPEATAELCERRLPGLPELMRLAGMEQSRLAALWRIEAGFRGRALVINLPAAEQAASVALHAVMPLIPYLLEIRQSSWS